MIGATPQEQPPDAGGGERAQRRIKGRTLAERRLERREAMLAAGLDLFGTKGFAATTVEEVCRRAYVSSRNFYEEFDNRLDLLVAVGERIVAAAFAAWSDSDGLAAPAGPEADLAARRIRARVSVLVHTLVDDARVARVSFVETVGIDPAHDALRRQMLGVFPAWLGAYLESQPTYRDLSARQRMTTARGLFGAGHELITDWVLQDPGERVTVDELIEDIVGFALMVLRPPPGGGRPA